jgi:hypothetical protein
MSLDMKLYCWVRGDQHIKMTGNTNPPKRRQQPTQKTYRHIPQDLNPL